LCRPISDRRHGRLKVKLGVTTLHQHFGRKQNNLFNNLVAWMKSVWIDSLAAAADYLALRLFPIGLPSDSTGELPSSAHQNPCICNSTPACLWVSHDAYWSIVLNKIYRAFILVPNKRKILCSIA
jgi:hypothetical protein